jgi:hypothetical protein
MAGYLGNVPSAVPLTSADIADGIITTAKIADGNITSTKILDGTILNADINASAGIVTSKLSGALGITEADSWRLTAYNPTTGDITSNLERDDTSGFGYVGTGMTESSGIFTFPSTGIYLVTAHWTFTVTGENQTIGAINTTINNSSYTLRAEAFASSTGTDHYKGSTSSILFDVTSTANCKVKFELKSLNVGCGAIGGTSLNYTHFIFIKLAET